MLEAKDKMSKPFQDAARNANRLSKNVNNLGNKVSQNKQKVSLFTRTLKVAVAPIKAVSTAIVNMNKKMAQAIGNSKVGQLTKQTRAWKLMSSAVNGTKQSVRAAALATGIFVQNNSKIQAANNAWKKIKGTVDRVKQSLSLASTQAKNAQKNLNNTGTRGRASFNQLVQSNQKLNSQLERMNRQLKRANGGFKSMRSNISAVNALGATFTALYTGQAVAAGVGNLTSSTVGKAMEQQYSAESVSILAGDEKKGAAFTKQIQEYASATAFSPEEWSSSLRGAIKKSDSVKDLEKYQVVMEQLATLDPAQGLEGAALAVRELNSGDSMSLVERFELPRGLVNDIKNMEDPVAQMVELSKIIGEETGYTADAIQDMKKLPLMQWEKLKNTVQTAMGYMGKGAMEKIAPYIEKINKMYADGKFDAFIKTASDGLAKAATSVIDFGIKVASAFGDGSLQQKFAPFITLFKNIASSISEAWPTVQPALSGIRDMVTEMVEVLNENWPTINSIFQTVVGFAASIVNWITGHWPAVISIIGGVVTAIGTFKVVTTIAAGINILKAAIAAWRNGTLIMAAAQWIMNTAWGAFTVALLANPIGLVIALIAGLAAGLVIAWKTSDTFREKVMAAWGWIKDVGAGAIDMGTAAIDRMSDALSAAVGWVGSLWDSFGGFVEDVKNTKINWSGILPGGKKFIEWGGGSDGKHHGGLSNVPRDGYNAILHKGERVLTAMENKAYTQGQYSQGSTAGVTITGNTFHVRKDSDIDAIADALYSRLSAAKTAMG